MYIYMYVCIHSSTIYCPFTILVHYLFIPIHSPFHSYMCSIDSASLLFCLDYIYVQ